MAWGDPVGRSCISCLLAVLLHNYSMNLIPRQPHG